MNTPSSPVSGDLKSEDANQTYREHSRHSAKDPELLRAMGFLNDKKIAQAEQLCRNYLKRVPTDVSAIRLLADIGIRHKIFRDALQLLERCLELAPDYHLARLNYANALSGMQQPQAALEQMRILEKAEPEKRSHLVLKASILVQAGEFSAALSCYERLLADYQPQAKIRMSYGHTLKTVGRQPEAIQAYRGAIALSPSLGEAYWSLANLKTFYFDDADIAAMRGSLACPDIARTDYFHLCFALGKALEDRNSHAEAFDFYSRGNAIKQKQEAYSAAVNHAETQRLICTCTSELFASRVGQGSQRVDPIFIVGLPRSGSTLLEQVIASHSMVDGTRELPDIIAIARQLGQREKKTDVSRYPEVLSELPAEQLQALGEEYLEQAQVQRGSAPYFIDKMPNNFAHLGLIQLILPNAKIIDARRQPMAACFSGFKQLFANGQHFSYGLEDIGRYYCDYVTLMDHWDRVLPGPEPVLRVMYEDMVSDTEVQVRRILEYCGLPFEQACLNFHLTERPIRSASSEQVRQPIFRSGLDQWKHFEPCLGELRASLGPL